MSRQLPFRRALRFPLVLLAALSAATGAAVAQDASAAPSEGGLAAAPTEVDFGGVIRGEPVERSVTIYNSRSEEAYIAIERGTGELAQWLHFPKQNLTMPGNSSLVLPYTLDVPADIPNGKHVGDFKVLMRPPNSTAGAGFNADVAIAVLVRGEATVGGPQVVRASAGELKVSNAEVGSTVPVSVVVRNLGNVRVSPVMELEVRDVAGNVIAREVRTLDTVRAGAKETLQTRVDAPLTPGQYWLHARVLLADAPLLDEKMSFDVLQVGELKRSGVMGAVSVEDLRTRAPTNRLQAGESFRVVASFTNTGETDVEAVFHGHISLEGRIVEVLESQPLRLRPGEDTTFRLLIAKPLEAGRYSIVGHIDYGGKVTPESETILTVQPAPLPQKTPGVSMPLVLVVVGLAAAVAGASRLRR